MDRSRCIRDDERGFTLIEVLMTILILLVGLGGAVSLTIGANAATSRTKAREAGTNLNRELIEASRGVPYAKLTPNGLRDGVEAQTQTDLADSTPSDPTWTIERRGTTFTVTPAVCSVDDPRDGIGTQVSGTFCSTATPTNPADDTPDDYKRVTFEVAWGGSGGAPLSTAKQATIITNPSNSVGPRITSFTHDGDPEMVTTDDDITFTTVTEVPAEAVRFLIDGTVAHTATPSGTSATFEWDITDVVDGTYVVSANALDSAGQTGATRSLTVRLNVDAPSPPTAVVGGWNATRAAVDLDWARNPELDILGYRVYRTPDGGATEEVCETGPTVTTCHDAAPPAATAYAYEVVALDEADASGGIREGAPSAALGVVPTTFAPNPPASLTGSVAPGGYQLDWTAPLAPAPAYTGQEILFFRIYRGGTDVADRYDFTGLGTELTFTDGDVAGEQQAYYVTAVDQNYSESLPIGPVVVDGP